MADGFVPQKAPRLNPATTDLLEGLVGLSLNTPMGSEIM